MTPDDLIRNQVRSKMLKDKFSERDANIVAENAVRKYHQNTKHQVAIKEAITEGKKLYKPRGVRNE